MFIALFIIVALSVSWLVFSFVFGDQSRKVALARTEPSPAIPAHPAVAPTKRSTCRDQVTAAAKAITREKGVNEFAAQEIIEYLIKKGTDYSTSTIRGSISNDFERVARGRYRLAGG